MHDNFTNDQIATALGTGLGLGVFALIAIFFIAIIAVTIFYFLLLQRTMNRVSEFNRPFPGGLVWLGLIPLLNIFWLPIFQIMLSVAIKKDFLAAGRVDHGDAGLGLAIAMAVCLAVFWIPFVGGLAALAHIVLFIIYWVKIAAVKDKMPVRAVIISAPIYPPRF